MESKRPTVTFCPPGEAKNAKLQEFQFYFPVEDDSHWLAMDEYGRRRNLSGVLPGYSKKRKNAG